MTAPPHADAPRLLATTTMPGVLLDANVYRYRSLDEVWFTALVEAERRRGVARYADPFVVSETLAHLADPVDEHFGPCRRANGRVYRRCNVSTGGECGILQDSESRLAELVTGKALARHDEYTERVIAPLFADIALTPLDQPLTRMGPHLRAIAAHVAEQKARFADTGRRLQAIIEATLAGDGREERKETLRRARRTHESPATRRAFAETIIRGTYTNAGLAPPEPLPDALVARVLPSIATAVEFEALIWEKLAFDGAKPDSPRIRTLRWDQRIAFNIGRSMHGRPLWLVTDDGDFTRAAKAAGYEDRVHTLDAYERWLSAQ